MSTPENLRFTVEPDGNHFAVADRERPGLVAPFDNELVAQWGADHMNADPAVSDHYSWANKLEVKL